MNLLWFYQIPIVPDSDCREVYGNETITDDMLCAAPSDGSADACAGDSGAPLLCQHAGQWFQVVQMSGGNYQ